MQENICIRLVLHTNEYSENKQLQEVFLHCVSKKLDPQVMAITLPNL